MARFALARAAVGDLESIADYTAERWGARQAAAYLEALEIRLRDLAERPASGRARDALAPGLRSFPFESHVIFYQQTEDGIVVARILHQRQDPERHLG